MNLKIAGFMCLGFNVGGLFGAKIATGLSNEMLQKVFGVVLLLVSLKMIFWR